MKKSFVSSIGQLCLAILLMAVFTHQAQAYSSSCEDHDSMMKKYANQPGFPQPNPEICNPDNKSNVTEAVKQSDVLCTGNGDEKFDKAFLGNVTDWMQFAKYDSKSAADANKGTFAQCSQRSVDLFNRCQYLSMLWINSCRQKYCDFMKQADAVRPTDPAAAATFEAKADEAIATMDTAKSRYQDLADRHQKDGKACMVALADSQKVIDAASYNGKGFFGKQAAQMFEGENWLENNADILAIGGIIGAVALTSGGDDKKKDAKQNQAANDLLKKCGATTSPTSPNNPEAPASATTSPQCQDQISSFCNATDANSSGQMATGVCRQLAKTDCKPNAQGLVPGSGSNLCNAVAAAEMCQDPSSQKPSCIAFRELQKLNSVCREDRSKCPNGPNDVGAKLKIVMSTTLTESKLIELCKVDANLEDPLCKDLIAKGKLQLNNSNAYAGAHPVNSLNGMVTINNQPRQIAGVMSQSSGSLMEAFAIQSSLKRYQHQGILRSSSDQ